MFFSFRRIAVTTGGIAALGTQPCFMSIAILLGQQLKKKGCHVRVRKRKRKGAETRRRKDPHSFLCLRVFALISSSLVVIES